MFGAKSIGKSASHSSRVNLNPSNYSSLSRAIGSVLRLAKFLVLWCMSERDVLVDLYSGPVGLHNYGARRLLYRDINLCLIGRFVFAFI